MILIRRYHHDLYPLPHYISTILMENNGVFQWKQEADSFKSSANMPYIMLQKI